MVLLTFAVSDHFQEESGLVAVTVLGLVLANQTYVDIDAVLEFAESLQVLVLSSLFLLLAARLDFDVVRADLRSEEHTSELQSLMRISYAVFCLKKKKIHIPHPQHNNLPTTHEH